MSTRISLLLMLLGLGFTRPAAGQQVQQVQQAQKVLRLEGVININTATPDELQLLPGVGPAKVRNVLAYRRAHPFRTVDELVRIKGIGRKMVRRLRMNLAVSGPTTAQQVIRLVEQPPPPTPPQPPPPAATPPKPTAPAPTPGRRPSPPTPFPTAPANHCIRGP